MTGFYKNCKSEINKFNKDQFVQLSSTNMFELTIFLMYLLGKLPEYNVISNVLLMTSQDYFLRICEYFGGQTITIPTIQDVKDMLRVIEMYNRIDIKKQSYAEVVQNMELTPSDITQYAKLKILLKDHGIEENK